MKLETEVRPTAAPEQVEVKTVQVLVTAQVPALVMVQEQVLVMALPL